MKQYSFATIITSKDAIPIATQLPFVVEENEGRLLLSSHFAKANEQAGYIEKNTSLIIFAEPHAYISPQHYNKRESVPTWNYIAVHAYGQARIIEDDVSKIAALEKMINYYDQSYQEQWKTLSDKFKTGMLGGITAFEIEVTDLQAQQKLSQNKTAEERNRIIQQLQHGSSSAEKEIAEHMLRL